jgi:hypothetical protein
MLIYAPLLAVFILIFAAITIGILRVYRPNFAYAWIIAALGAIVAWPLVLVSISSAPQIIPLTTWDVSTYFPSSSGLVIDQVSWAFAVVISTLVLSGILTDAARASDADSAAWSSSLALSGLGIFAVLAGNPLTLLFLWTAIDITQLVIMIWRLKPGQGLDRAMVSFSARAAGIFLFVLSIIYTPQTGVRFGFQTLSSISSFLLILAAGLRLGVLPLSGPDQSEFKLPRGLGTISQLIPAAASLVLVVRIADISASTYFIPLLLLFSWAAGVYGGYLWTVSQDELEGRSYWVIAVGSLAFASALRGMAEASLAWSIVGLLTGGLIFLMSARQKYSIAFLILGLLTLSGLPFTPTSSGMLLYSTPFNPMLFLFVLPHALMLVGYLKQATRERELLPGVERWVRIIYPWGLSLLLLVQVVISWWGVRPILNEIGLLVAMITFILAALIYWAYLRGYRVPHIIENILEPVLSLRWLRRIIQSMYTITGRLLNGINSVLEGEGGVLWAILLLILLIAYFSQVGIGE